MHLAEFLDSWLPGGRFPVDVDGHLSRDDTDVLVAIKQAAADPQAAGHRAACRIVDRDHFKVAYEKQATPKGADSEPGRLRADSSTGMQALARAAAKHFGSENIAYGAPPSRKKPPDFAVRSRDGRSSSWASGISDVFRKLPEYPDEYVLADGAVSDDVRRWLEANLESILADARTLEIEQAEEDVA